ncbi:Phage integrase family protein [Planctomycetes bacterium Pan216]|uniref:Phage integrase family protein n=1 Tax=Kolteria novifilia TaxID=2527975 RepID=A0A518AYZ8_9BACT|nr:Phage integrase family protein [Planctomycetes bacterium Pan216]
MIREVLFPLADRFPTAEGDIGFIHGRLHSFRHFFCSMCANRGVGQQVVRRWLGHKESRMVDHYYHLHDDEARRQMQRLRLFGEADGNGAVGQ